MSVKNPYERDGMNVLTSTEQSRLNFLFDYRSEGFINPSGLKTCQVSKPVGSLDPSGLGVHSPHLVALQQYIPGRIS